jgi:copper(I)-binding protein
MKHFLLLVTTALFAESSIACPGLSAKDAWVREVPTGSSVAAGYLVLTNSGKTAQTIDAVRSPQFARAEMHEMSHDKGMMRMRAIPALTIAAGATEELSPGGEHLMLFKPSVAIQAGTTVDIELVCGKDVTKLSVPVRKAADTSHKHHDHD